MVETTNWYRLHPVHWWTAIEHISDTAWYMVSVCVRAFVFPALTIIKWKYREPVIVKLRSSMLEMRFFLTIILPMCIQEKTKKLNRASEKRWCLQSFESDSCYFIVFKLLKCFQWNLDAILSLCSKSNFMPVSSTQCSTVFYIYVQT